MKSVCLGDSRADAFLRLRKAEWKLGRTGPKIRIPFLPEKKAGPV